MYASSASDRCLGIVNRPSDPRRKRRNLFLIEACCSFPNAKEAGMTPTGKSETAWDRWRNATRRYERNTRSVKQTSHGLIARSICIHGISDFISRESSSVSHLSPFLMYLHRYSSPPLNERLIPLACLSVLFVTFLLSGFLGRSLAGLPARPYRHSIASASLFSTLSPVTSPLSRRRADPILPRCMLWTFLSPCPHLSSPLLSSRSPALCTRKRMEKNDRGLGWKVSPPISPHG